MENINRYIAVVQWARERYSKNGLLPLQHGNNPSTYTKIEQLAFAKYITKP